MDAREAFWGLYVLKNLGMPASNLFGQIIGEEVFLSVKDLDGKERCRASQEEHFRVAQMLEDAGVNLSKWGRPLRRR